MFPWSWCLMIKNKSSSSNKQKHVTDHRIMATIIVTPNLLFVQSSKAKCSSHWPKTVNQSKIHNILLLFQETWFIKYKKTFPYPYNYTCEVEIWTFTFYFKKWAGLRYKGIRSEWRKWGSKWIVDMEALRRLETHHLLKTHCHPFHFDLFMWMCSATSETDSVDPKWQEKHEENEGDVFILCVGCCFRRIKVILDNQTLLKT